LHLRKGAKSLAQEIWPLCGIGTERRLMRQPTGLECRSF